MTWNDYVRTRGHRQLPPPFGKASVRDNRYACKFRVSPVNAVRLVAKKELADVVRMSVQLSEPIHNMIKRFLVRHIVDNDDTVSASVIAVCDRPETLMPCCIPELYLGRLVSQLRRQKKNK